MEHQESATPIELQSTDSRPIAQPTRPSDIDKSPLSIDCSSPSNASNSVPSLRFPRPLGNRQLHNWVSSSSPDIMQPSQAFEEDSSLADLGYDIIGTDGESQADSTTSSIDYQRIDVQSLNGTDTGTDVETVDAETDSSDDDEDTPLDDTEPVSVGTPSENGHLADTADHISDGGDMTDASDMSDDDSAEPASYDSDLQTLAACSLESPTDSNQHGIRQRLLESVPLESQADESVETIRGPTQEHLDDQNPTTDNASPRIQADKILDLDGSSNNPEKGWNRFYKSATRAVMEHRHAVYKATTFVMAIAILATIPAFLAEGVSRFIMPTSKVLSTVPVAHVAPVSQPSASQPASMAIPISSATHINIRPVQTLETDASPKSLAILSFGKDYSQTQGSIVTVAPRICSVDKMGRNQIMIRIPQDVKSSWMSRDALMIAVSRGPVDLPTVVSSVENGFMIELPVAEAYGAMDVSIASTRKPRINESFQVNFGRHAFGDAFDAGKQLVRGLAHQVVKTANDTSLWAEEACLPAFDLVSRQVSIQTTSFSDSVKQGLNSAQESIAGLSSRFVAKAADRFEFVFGGETFGMRQRRLEWTNFGDNIRDEVSLSLLSAQLGSKLLWLKVQGKSEEYQHYLDNAESYYQKRTNDAEDARRERRALIAKEIRARRKQARREARSSFWSQ